MANDKKFIVKNGLLTPENAVIGSTNDTGEKLQVTGSSKFSGVAEISQNDFNTPSLSVTNTGGYLFSSPIAEFKGDSDSLIIQNVGVGDYKLVNSQQNNGIIFYDSSPGIRLLYNNSPRLAISSSGNRFYGLATTTIDNNRILTTADEGSGNGLDADTVDGLEGNQFVRSDVDDIMAGNYTIQQDLTIDGNLTVSGTTTTVNTEEILLADNIITLNSNYTGSSPTENSGIEIERGTLDNPKILWDEANDYWKLISGTLSDLGRIITTADEGSGNGFDADTVDGLEASQFLRSDVDDTAAGNITIQGDLTVGDDGGPAQIVFNGSGQDRVIYSNSGEIGFLNASFNFAMKSDAAGDLEVQRDVEAGRNVIGATGVTATTGNVTASAGDVVAQNNVTATTGDVSATAGNVTAGDSVTAQNDITATTGDIAASAGSVTAQVNVTATTGDVSATAGNVTAGDSMTAQNDITATTGNIDATAGNVTAGDSITAQNDITATTGNIAASAGSVSAATTVTAGTDVIGQRFLDADDNAYLANPAGNSFFSGLGLDDNLFHIGDTDTRLRFETATIDLDTDGTTRLTANNSGVFVYGNLTVDGDISGDDGNFINVYASRFYDADDNGYYVDPASTSVMKTIGIDDYIQHNSDADNYFGFPSNDSQTFVTGGIERFEIDNVGVTAKVAFDSTVSVTAPIFYDANDATYYGDFASTSRINTISLNGTIIHDGDADTFLNFPGANRFEVQTGGAQRLEVNDTGVDVTGDLDVTGDISAGGDVSGATGTFTGDVTAARFVDADDNAYFADPAGSSEFHELQIDDYLRHRGNVTTYLGFPANNQIRFATDGTERLLIDTTYITASLDGIFPNLYAGTYYDSSNATFYTRPASTSRMQDIALVGKVHRDGDTNDFMRFPADNQIEFQTNGAQRLLITNGYVLANNQMRSPIYYDQDNTNYFTNPAATSQMNRIDIDDYIRHRGDVDTYFGFVGNDSFRVVTGSNARLDINNTNATFYYDVLADRFVDRQNANYFVNPADGTSSGQFAGGIRITNISDYANWDDTSGNGGIGLAGHNAIATGQNPTITIAGNHSGGYSLMYLNRIDPGPNPFDGGNRYLHFYYDGTAGATIRGDSSGNVYLVPASSRHMGFWTDGGNEIAVALNDGNFVVGGSSVTYASMDNTPLVGSITNSRLHVNGGIQLNGNDDAIVFGRGTSSFLKDEELGFGWGGGWYMTDATYLRVRNNKAVYSTGSAYFSIVYDSDDANYYTNPASTSQMNRIDIDDYIRHRGDTNTFFGFESNDTFRVWTNGTQRLNIDNNSADFQGNVYAPRYYDSNATSRYIEPGGGGLLQGNFEFAASSTATGYSVAAIELRESNYTGNGTATPPRIAFHWGGVVASQIAVESNGTIAIRNNPGTGYEKFRASIATFDEANIGITRTSNYGYFGGASQNGQSHYQWEGATYRNPGTYTTRLYVRQDNATGGINGSMPALALYNHRGIDQGTTSLVFASREADGSGNAVNLAGIIAKKEGAGTANAWSTGSLHFFTKAQGTRRDNMFMHQDGYVQSPFSFRAPIFYDSNNTGFYGNFASTSRMNTVTVDRVNMADRGDFITFYGDDGNNHSITSRNTAGSASDDLRFNSYNNFLFNADANNNNDNSAGIYLGQHGGGAGTITNTWVFQARNDGVTQASGSMRAPIFYDSNDTNYYVDPNGTSRLNILNVNSIDTGSIYTDNLNNMPMWAGDIVINGNENTYYPVTWYGGNQDLVTEIEIYRGYSEQAPWDPIGSGVHHGGLTCLLRTNFGGWGGSTYDIQFDDFRETYTTIVAEVGHFGNQRGFVIWLRGGGTGGAIYHIRVKGRNFGPTVSYSAYDPGGNGTGVSPRTDTPQTVISRRNQRRFDDMFARRFYDADNTNYYVDPDGTSIIRRLKSNTTSSSSALRALTIKDQNTGEINFGSYPGAWTSALQIQNNDNTDFIWISPLQNGTSARFRTGGSGLDFYTDGANNTGTHSGFIGSGYVQGISSIRAPIFYDTNNTGYYVDPAGTSFQAVITLQQNPVGQAYAGVAAQPTYYFGQMRGDNDAWKIYGESPSGTNTGNLILQSEDDYDSNESIRFRFKRTYGAYDTNDVLQAFYNYVYSPSSFRAPIFYDSNNTAFYTNQAGESRLNSLRTAGQVVIGGTFQNNPYNSVGSTRLMFGGGDSNAQGNYFIGTNLENYNGNYTKLDLRWHTGIRMGAQAVYGGTRIYNNEDLQTVLFSVGKGDSHVRVESGNNLYVEGGDARATIFYDWNDTNYYANPNSTSRFYEQRIVYRLHIGNETSLHNGILGGRADLTIRDQYPQLNIASHRINNGTHGPTLRFMAYDSANATTGNFKHWVIGTAGTNATALHFGYSPNQSNPHYGIGRGWSSGNNVSMFWLQNDRHVYAENDVRALRFVDRNNSNYFVDPDSRSDLYDMRLRGNYVRTYAHSGSDFTAGTLVATSIPATAQNGASFVLEATGKSYSGDPPFSFTAQGYLYNNTIISYSGQHFGKPGFTTLYMFQYNGTLHFWWPRVSYWNSFAVHVRNANGDDRNLVTSITNSGLPGGRTKERAVTMKVTAVYNQNINTGDLYAKRYYDSDSTFYYGDFASASRMYQINAYESIRYQGGAPAYFYTSSGNLRGYIRATESNDSHFEFATSGGEDFIFRDGGFGGSWNQIIRGNGHVLISSRLDVPIMYDRNDTNYYVDPRSNSRFNTGEFVGTLTSNGQYYTNAPSDYWTTSITGLTNAPISTRNRDYNVGGTSRYLPLTHQTALYSSGYRTHLNTGLYKLASGWGDGTTGWYAAIGGNDSYPTQAWYLTYGGYIQNSLGYVRTSGSFRAPIFYDQNNTGRYIDPNGTSRLQRVEFYGRTQFIGREADSAGSGSYGGGRIAEYMGNVAAEFHSGNDQPVTIYFRSGVNAPSDHAYITFDPDYDNSGENAALVLGVENDGTGSSDYIRLQSRVVVDSDLISSDSTTMMDWRYRNTIYGRINTDYMDHISDMRAPIFYDRNNTNYYVDPASTTQLHYVLADNWFRPQGNTGIYWQSYGRGIWAPESGGNSYGNVTTYGGGRNGWQGWGIGSRHVFMSTGGDNVGIHDNSRGWLMYWNGSYTRFNYGYTIMDGSARSPIFYDLNDTTYYFNGASTNSTRFRGVQPETMAYMQLPGHTRSSKEYYAARPRITGDSNYWTGAVGWSRVDMNTVGNWGSGFFDSWSNPPNQPSGTSHWVGVQAYHYTNGSARYGWQLAGGPISNLRFRNSWSGFSGWTTVAMHDRNDGSSGGLYAGIYYDSNNTGFFVDPNGRSRLSSIDYGSSGYYFRSGDWGWRHQTPYGWIQFGPANGSHAHIYTDRSNFYFNVNEMYMNGRSILKENYWNGNKYFGSDGAIYGTIFYDTNDSAFYFNGASTNSTRFRGVQPETMAYMGLPGHTRNSGEYYRARPRQTGDSNYWTGAFGWGRNDMNVVSTWGSGFIDSWSNPPNQPSGTSHWVGCQAFHYRSSNTSGYGWQMVGGPIQNLRFRSSWAGWRSWRTIPVLDINEGNGGAMYAGIYYDSNDTNYYMDPRSTSRWVTSNQNGYHTFQNYGLGVTGTYTSTRLQLVFAMGSSYRPNSAGTSTANMYGIGWSHPNAGSLGGANQLNDHGMLIINNGSFRAAISSRAVFSSDIRSPIFYDWNSTGYYLDPHSTSNSALRIRGGTLHGPNPTWGAYLAVGTNGHWSSSYASVATTNGNLHLDSSGGRDLYLQWYIGRNVYVNATMYTNGLEYFRQNTAMYIDIRGSGNTSRMGELVINDGVRLRSPNGNYGSFCVDGAARGGYEGFSIGDRVVMMHNNSGVAGMYNDVNNEWMMRFDLNSYCILYHNGSEKLRTRTDGIQAQAFFYSSDERLKENIVTIENAVDKVKKLRGVEYNWKEDGQRDIGLIAQEVQEVIPEVVRVQDTSDEAEGTLVDENPKDKIEDVLSVEYGHMVGLLVEAVKEQQEQIEDQKNQIEQLKEMVDTLLKR